MSTPRLPSPIIISIWLISGALALVLGALVFAVGVISEPSMGWDMTYAGPATAANTAAILYAIGPLPYLIVAALCVIVGELRLAERRRLQTAAEYHTVLIDAIRSLTQTTSTSTRPTATPPQPTDDTIARHEAQAFAAAASRRD